MRNERVRSLFNTTNERRDVVVGVVQSVAGRGPVALVTACYTIWMIACCAGRPLPTSISITGSAGIPLLMPSWIAPVLVMAVASMVIAIWFRRTRKVYDNPLWLIVLASLMTLAAALHLIWATDRTLPIIADTVMYGMASVLTGVGSALFRVEIDRVYGWIGTQQTLYQSLLGTLTVVLAFSLGMFLTGEWSNGLVLLYGTGVVIPFLLVACMRRIVRGYPRKRYYDHGRDVALPFPTKFVLTSFAQGIATGMTFAGLFVLGMMPSDRGSICLMMGYVLAIALLFATLVFMRLDFNRIIYKVAFSFVALGFLVSAIEIEGPWIGMVVLFAGFCYLDLVLWSLGACFMKNMGLPATWMASCPGAALFFGAVIGGVAATVLLTVYPTIDVALFASFIACFLLAVALLLSSGSNLKHGWGMVLPGEGDLASDDLAGIVRFVATERGVTQRETEVMLLLARGKTRRSMCEELTVSPDTVKTHVRAVYRKLGVHSQQELVDRIVVERERLVEDGNELTMK